MNELFYLRGTKRTVTAEGIHKWIRTPAIGGSDLHGNFEKEIQRALNEARSAGIESPIVVGTIPFDPAEQSALYVPKTYQIHDGPVTPVEKKDKAPEIIECKQIPEHDSFTSIVSEAVNEIHNDALKKVVLARLNVVETRDTLDSGDVLARLIEQNPKGYNFHTPLPQENTFLVGSSPELLIAKHGAHFYSTPLAGSAPRDPFRDSQKEQKIVEQLLASRKDQYEHKVVVSSMRNTLAPKSAELEVSDTPECLSTPKLFHLATKISGKVADVNETALSLACLLHPTPALSGFPHETAHQLLKRLEPFDRRYFGGIVGYSDSNGDGEWFIVIRSGELQGNQITLFGGAGIVNDSDPESEWRETETKISTMLHAIDLV